MKYLLTHVCLGLLLFCGLAISQQQDSHKADTSVNDNRRFVADIQVTIGSSKRKKAELYARDIVEKLDAFYNNTKTFRLSDLQALKITNLDRVSHKLTDLATIDVTFSKLPVRSNLLNRNQTWEKDGDLAWPLATDGFKSLSYLQAAVMLQAMEKDDKVRKLREMAKRDDPMDLDVIVLCRMLFTRSKRPALGIPTYMGDSIWNSDWPLTPIEIVDGIPFFVVTGYGLSGLPESCESYLEDCIENCDWSRTRFTLPNEKVRKRALEKVLASPKWRRPLDKLERSILEAQIK